MNIFCLKTLLVTFAVLFVLSCEVMSEFVTAVPFLPPVFTPVACETLRTFQSGTAENTL